jgi:hypothetical protein
MDKLDEKRNRTLGAGGAGMHRTFFANRMEMQGEM